MIYSDNLARTESAVDGHRRRLKCNHHSWFLKTAIKKEAIKYGFTTPHTHPVLLLVAYRKVDQES